jgi:hypothetical protein
MVTNNWCRGRPPLGPADPCSANTPHRQRALGGGGGSLARTVTAELVRRCGELKGELVACTPASRFARRVAWNDVNRIDHVILQQRLPDGRTMIDLFVAARPDLSENERRIVLGWRNVVETITEVRSHQHDTVEAVGVIDELPYRIHSTTPVQRLEVLVPVTAHAPPGGWRLAGEVALLTARPRSLPSSRSGAGSLDSSGDDYFPLIEKA